jgi:hypothetical protein
MTAMKSTVVMQVLCTSIDSIYYNTFRMPFLSTPCVCSGRWQFRVVGCPCVVPAFVYAAHVISTSALFHIPPRARTSKFVVLYLLRSQEYVLSLLSVQQVVAMSCNTEHSSVQNSLIYPATYESARLGRINARTGLSNTTQMLVHWFVPTSFGPE